MTAKSDEISKSSTPRGLSYHTRGMSAMTVA